jgi:hypothetical protein
MISFILISTTGRMIHIYVSHFTIYVYVYVYVYIF